MPELSSSGITGITPKELHESMPNGFGRIRLFELLTLYSPDRLQHESANQ
jgi:hypothetical protein